MASGGLLQRAVFVACVGAAGLMALSFEWASGESLPIPTPEPGELTLIVEPWVRLPDRESGARPRLNAMATDGTDLYVVEDYDAKVYRLVGSGPTVELFIDVKRQLHASTGRSIDNTNVAHGGLRAIAFHPEYGENGLFYTSHMEKRPNDPTAHHYLSDAGVPIVADSVLGEWREVGSGDFTYREVFRVGMPVYDHPIKQIAFDPYARPGDPNYGHLYIAHGDGSVQSAIAGGGQRADALGKVLRIDPRESEGRPYVVPAANPFVGSGEMLDEVFTLGHRNPHSLAFVPTPAGSILLSAEAGRDNVEEVNRLDGGSNYGWSLREGTFVHRPEGGGVANGVAPLPEDDASFGFTYPVAQVPHVGAPGTSPTGEAIVGGYAVTNGSPLHGRYFFADFPLSGRMYHAGLDELFAATTRLDVRESSLASPDSLTQARVSIAGVSFDHDANLSTPQLRFENMGDLIAADPSYDGSGRADVRFGQGPDGTLYVLNKRNGWIYRVVNSIPSADGRTETTTCDRLSRTQLAAARVGAPMRWTGPENAPGSAIRTPERSGNAMRGPRSDRGAAEFCVVVHQPGRYSLTAEVAGPGPGSNSFWVTVDDGAPTKMSYPVSRRLVERTVGEFSLEAGEHKILFSTREDGSILRTISLTLLGESTTPPVQIPPQPPPPEKPAAAEQCGLSGEAELGVISGSMVVDADAVGAPERSGNNLRFGPRRRGSVEVCLRAPSAGMYDLFATVLGPSTSSNSFWVTLGSGDVRPRRFSFDRRSEFVERRVGRYRLTAGEHLFTFWVREDGTLVDNMSLR